MLEVATEPRFELESLPFGGLLARLPSNCFMANRLPVPSCVTSITVEFWPWSRVRT